MGRYEKGRRRTRVSLEVTAQDGRHTYEVVDDHWGGALVVDVRFEEPAPAAPEVDGGAR